MDKKRKAKKVVILLSTYNGEKYLEEQINSLLEQVDVEISILVRDDGSTDNTKNMLKSWQEQGILKWYEGKNLKPAKSFLDLVRKSEKADYYAYCDQDDVWHKDKLKKAIYEMEKYNSTMPILYMSTYEVVDQDLNFLSIRNLNFQKPFTLASTIVERCPSGCTMVFNNRLCELISIYKPKYIRMHDYWSLMIVEAFNGIIITDDKPRLKYRQHNNNAVGYGCSRKEYIKRLLYSAIYGNNERQRQVISLYNGYSHLLSQDSLNTLLKVVQYRNSIKNRFELAFDKEFRTLSPKINILFIISVLLGLF